MAVWEAMGTAELLSVRVIRGGRPLLVTWAVSDPRTAASEEAASPAPTP